MGKRESNPLQKVTSVWESADTVYRDHVSHIWPELGEALYRLADAEARVVTDPRAVAVPPMADPGPTRLPRSRSAGRSGVSRPQPTSTLGNGSQMALFDMTEDEK